MKCWASLIGDCSGGSSREHFISDGIFDETVITVFGLPWCKDQPVNIGLKNAVSKILCQTHNNQLSPYDSEAAKLSRFLSATVLDKPLKNEIITINGILLEKWSIKTMINLGYLGALDQPMHSKIEPEEALVRYLFQNTDFRDGIGLYFVSGGLSNTSYKTGVSWDAILNKCENDKIVGMLFTFNGIQFITCVVPVRAEELVSKMGLVNGTDFSSAQIIYRPPNIILDSADAGSKRINLIW
ncbi:MAG: hypothetical protein Q8O04_07195 [Deltaproteobacteria bacterium]|nr:hypothetical protein [Deltaproteobacteria bacterium]